MDKQRGAVLLLIGIGLGLLWRFAPVLGEAAQERLCPPDEPEGVTEHLPELWLSQGFGTEWQAETLPYFVEPEEPHEYQVSAPADAGPKPYPETWDLSGGSIRPVTYGRYSGAQYFSLDGGAQVQNLSFHTNAALYAESQLLPDFRIKRGGEPQVLIMHTHTTESFEPYEREAYDSTFNYRTTDNSKNVVMVGDAIAAQLEAAGIGVIHSDAVHDYPSYTGAYARSAETVRAILAEYPSIKVVLDIHRDAIGGGGVLWQPTVTADGRKASQVMIIAGCDDGTLDMPHYLQNFRFACLLQRQTEADWPGLMRPILFDYRKYNQDLTTGSLLIEVGSHGNTLEQSAYAGELIGVSLARALISIAE